MNPTRFKTAFKVSCLVCLLGLGIFLGLGGCVVRVKEAQLFHPQKVVADVRGMKDVESLDFTMDDGAHVCGLRVKDAKADGEMLFLLGNADTVAWRLEHARHLANLLHVNVSVVDYRGFGASGGTPSLLRCGKDATTLFDALQKLNPAQPVGIYGYSIGTGFSSQLAAKRPPRFLVLQAPPTSCEGVIAFWDSRLPWYIGWLVRLKPDAALLDPALRPIDFIAQVHCPMLVIHGTADEVIPHAMGEKMFAASGSKEKEMLSLPGIGHNNMDPRDARIDRALLGLMGKVRGK